MNNSKQIFAMALGLESPWYIEKVEFNRADQRLDIYLKFTKGYKFVSHDGNLTTAYDSLERTWQHLNFFQHHCFIHAKVPRVKGTDGKVRMVEVPWARPNSGFTMLFEAFAMLLIENEMPVNKVGEILKVNPNRIWNIFNYWVRRAYSEDKIEQLEKVGFDETSTKKGHNYVTTMVDLESRRVLHATQGKGSDCIAKCVSYLEDKEVSIENIKQVCIDMSPAYIAGVRDYLPQAQITFDKFHVFKEVNKAMDELRKLERKGNEMLKNHKYTFLKNKLSSKIRNERDLLMEMYPKLGEGYRLKEMFKDFWEIEDKEEAESYLAFWCDLAEDSNILPFKKVVKTIKVHWSGIVNYIESKVNNGILEGINSKIQLAKRRARGYRNIQNFIHMINFICGKLKFDYPQYST